MKEMLTVNTKCSFVFVVVDSKRYCNKGNKKSCEVVVRQGTVVDDNNNNNNNNNKHQTTTLKYEKRAHTPCKHSLPLVLLLHVSSY
jgi:hypothetical protein